MTQEQRDMTNECMSKIKPGYTYTLTTNKNKHQVVSVMNDGDNTLVVSKYHQKGYDWVYSIEYIQNLAYKLYLECRVRDLEMK